MAKAYQEMTKDELLREQESLLARYKEFQAKGLQLDMSRGKPCKEQLDLSVGMNDVKDYVSGGVGDKITEEDGSVGYNTDKSKKRS